MTKEEVRPNVDKINRMGCWTRPNRQYLPIERLRMGNYTSGGKNFGAVGMNLKITWEMSVDIVAETESLIHDREGNSCINPW